VEIRTSANATLDVGGAGASNWNMIGENLRGTLGASRSQPGWSVAPSLPRSSFPVPFAAPDFGPSMPSPGAALDAGNREARDRAAADLILPRFRAAATSAAVRPTADAARYRYSGGRWWFWQSSGSWLYWNGSAWQPPAQAQSEPPAR
jgi:hypothetical protein